MDTLAAIRETMRTSGHGLMKTSRLMGRNDSYMSSVFARGSYPSAPILAEIAAVNGYALALVPIGADLPDGSIPIDGRTDG